MTRRFWRWLRTDDLPLSHNIEDRRGEQLTDEKLWRTWQPEDVVVPVAVDPNSQLARDLGLHDIGSKRMTEKELDRAVDDLVYRYRASIKPRPQPDLQLPIPSVQKNSAIVPLVIAAISFIFWMLFGEIK